MWRKIFYQLKLDVMMMFKSLDLNIVLSRENYECT